MRNKTPAYAAWFSLHEKYPVAKEKTERRAGICGICRQECNVRSLTDVLSTQFTDWDKIPRDTTVICEECEWVYQIPLLRTSYLYFTAPDTARVLTREETSGMLLHSFSPLEALTLPLSGRKHLLPSCEWGTVTSDAGTFPWTVAEVELASAVRQLRESGASDAVLFGKDLLSPAVFVSEPQMWDMLTTVREWVGTPQLAMLVKVSRGWQSSVSVSAGSFSGRDSDDG